jgi:DNA-directed RNA polymerase specialized sigma54-like protein
MESWPPRLSQRFKRDIKPIAEASEALLRLKPVTFHYKSDAKNTPCFGLIAEEVAEVNPDLVVRNKNGEAWTVRYEQINAMLLNEFLKEHRKIQKQQKEIDSLKAEQEEQRALIQKVSARIEASKPATKVAVSSRP